MGSKTKVGRHPSKDYLADVTFSDLQDQIVVLRIIELVRADRNGLAVLMIMSHSLALRFSGFHRKRPKAFQTARTTTTVISSCCADSA